MSTSVDRMIAEGQERRRRRAAADRADFFANLSEPVPPSLEFETPVCPSCRQHTDTDGDGFWCDFCCLAWGRSGDGQPIDEQWCAEWPDHPLSPDQPEVDG